MAASETSSTCLKPDPKPKPLITHSNSHNQESTYSSPAASNYASSMASSRSGTSIKASKPVVTVSSGGTTQGDPYSGDADDPTRYK
ncbi:hypothetical protein NA57DRAFT_71994 [Rhizodiscina lignyota]|uniref:Uncharacterized protein n=1 Tax=Rhizodiscina lignyota TaxID=1504668 RepID=A0A9P4IK14_9PEZI|nr:hypothetical protein NA57DRAFT_71994 [Rhizodiscina lignyota]